MNSGGVLVKTPLDHGMLVELSPMIHWPERSVWARLSRAVWRWCRSDASKARKISDPVVKPKPYVTTIGKYSIVKGQEVGSDSPKRANR